jgi:hypothetical protein
MRRVVGWRHTLVIVAAVLAGCASDCEERVQRFDVVSTDPLYEYYVGLAGRLRADGWTCTSTSIREDGVLIGSAYTCTICD